MKNSRTYKLCLSDDGIELFLRCHCRVARLLRDFLPYGMTLSIAVAALDRQETAEVAAELHRPRVRPYLGDHIRYVGSSTITAALVTQICARLVEHNELSAPPKVLHLHIAAVLSLMSIEDEEVIRAAQWFDTMRKHGRIDHRDANAVRR